MPGEAGKRLLGLQKPGADNDNDKDQDDEEDSESESPPEQAPGDVMDYDPSEDVDVDGE